MRTHVNVITLGVRDLERALRFYRELGMSSPGIIGTEFVGDEENPGGSVAMFTLDNGLILSLYGRDDLAKDAGIPVARVSGSPISLGWFAGSRSDVDEALALARSAGGSVVHSPRQRPWGIYAGYFADPDDHLWEVVYFEQRDS
ncbi:VOC family protein [Nocardia sp. NBC_00508]|uniref:VOC family protein n=1 Tax=Nocardia sp. NBC_00508 TaxID=2975992 RepID=UPI002E7FF878|nr:VOC family protein [Nocardia sp. NBC_00508]WUD65603.1 VOC family protein [Nocardia sp. NBC_00508]